MNATLVLSVGDSVEEVTNTGFIDSSPTLHTSQIGDDSLIQIYPEGIRHIKSDLRVNEWKVPNERIIIKGTSNERQVDLINCRLL